MKTIIGLAGSLRTGSFNGFGTILSQNAWLPVLRTLGTKPWFGGQLLVSRAHQVFRDGGEITDVRLQEQIRQFVQGFAASL
jgi:chromate reductase, NAD(P)H dehydrogenase (quinone)